MVVNYIFLSPLILSFQTDVDFRERDRCLALATLIDGRRLVTYTEQHSQTSEIGLLC